MTQFERILELVEKNGGKVTTRELAGRGLYHKAASRLGVEAIKKGYRFEFKAGSRWDEGVYELKERLYNAPKASGNNDLSPEPCLFEDSYAEEDLMKEYGGCQ